MSWLWYSQFLLKLLHLMAFLDTRYEAPPYVQAGNGQGLEDESSEHTCAGACSELLSQLERHRTITFSLLSPCQHCQSSCKALCSRRTSLGRTRNPYNQDCSLALRTDHQAQKTISTRCRSKHKSCSVRPQRTLRHKKRPASRGSFSMSDIPNDDVFEDCIVTCLSGVEVGFCALLLRKHPTNTLDRHPLGPWKEEMLIVGWLKTKSTQSSVFSWGTMRVFNGPTKPVNLSGPSYA